MKRAIGVIPARWASTRLPGKSLVPIAGKPLVVRVAERALRARSLARVIVATDDLRICEAVAGLDVEAVMTRDDHQSGTDRVAEAVAGIPADVVVNVQGDEPLVDPGLIDRLAEALLTGPDWDMATASAPVANEQDLAAPSVVKVVTAADGRALYFSRAAIPFVRDGKGAPPLAAYRRHVGLYAYRRAFLARLVAAPPSRLEQLECLEQLRALHLGARMVVLETQDSGMGVDTPEDVARVERMIMDGEGCAAGC